MIKTALSGQTFLFLILSAVCFSGWNLLAKKVEVNQYWLTLVVCASTLCMVMISSVPKVIDTGISKEAILILIAAGAINGIGFIFYGKAMDSATITMSVFLPILFGTMVLFSMFGGIYFYNEPVSISKLGGVGLIVVGIYLINQ